MAGSTSTEPTRLPKLITRAAEAAETYWQASIGKKSGIGGIDVLKAWRPRFKKVRHLQLGEHFHGPLSA